MTGNDIVSRKNLFAIALGSAVVFATTIGGSQARGLADPRLNHRGTMSEVLLPAVVVPSDRNLAALIHAYKSDPMSRYQEIRYATRQNYDGLLRRWERDHGHEAITSLNGRRLRELHAEYLGAEGKKVVIAHGMIGMLRTLVGYGFTMLDSEECRTVKELLSSLKFKMGKPRKSAIQPQQVLNFIKKAHELDRPSMALAQAIQFSFGWRQKDVIGEYVPLDEPGEAFAIKDDMKSIRGLHWREFDSSLIVRHVTSKKDKAVEVDAKLCPLVMRELGRLPDGQILRGGPVVVCEKTGLPYTAINFRRTWRAIARAAGIPDHVFNMDNRSGRISQAFLLGATSSSVRKMATHSQQSQTDKYDRRDAEAIASVLTLCASADQQLMDDAA